MTITQLPSAASPSLKLVPATHEEMVAQSERNGVAWRGALSIEAYVRREAYLGATRLAADGGITAWVLIDTAAEERVTLSGCESLRKKALAVINGQVKTAVCHGIGGVFCPVEHRRRGYGARMMHELATTLETWQVDDTTEVVFSNLYSDIGKQFYATHGWHPYESAHVHLAAAKAGPQDDPAQTGLPAAQPLFANDVAALCVRDEAMIRKRLAAITDRTAVALLPDIDTMEWHWAREDFVSNELYGKKPFIKGAVVADEQGKHRVWCLWTRMWYNEDKKKADGNTMYILRLVVEDDDDDSSEEHSTAADRIDTNTDHDQSDATNGNATNGNATNGNHTTNGASISKTNGTSSTNPRTESQIASIAALLLVARQEAARWSMSNVEVWNPDSRTVAAAQRLDPATAVVHRDSESITSLRWHAGGGADDRVQWIANEKFGWC